jgi:hypothetical protein
MLWFMVLQIVSTLVELIQLRRTSASDKELEILLLRRQLAIYERKHRQPMRLTRGEKLGTPPGSVRQFEIEVQGLDKRAERGKLRVFCAMC